MAWTLTAEQVLDFFRKTRGLPADSPVPVLIEIVAVNASLVRLLSQLPDWDKVVTDNPAWAKEVGEAISKSADLLIRAVYEDVQ